MTETTSKIVCVILSEAKNLKNLKTDRRGRRSLRCVILNEVKNLKNLETGRRGRRPLQKRLLLEEKLRHRR